jgi:hypothetical protein
MPLTTGFTTRGLALKGKGHIHTDKWHRCIEHVEAKGGGYEPHAVCTHAIGYKESINPEHRTPGPHASANTRRFKESAKRRREAKEAQDYAAILKLDVHRVLKDHKCWGHECGGKKRHPSDPAPNADARPARDASAKPAADADARPYDVAERLKRKYFKK